MGILSSVLPFAPVIERVLDRVFPNPEDKAKAELLVLEMEQKGELALFNNLSQSDAGQVEINKVDAASSSFFQAGWRPAAGWVCVLALASQYFFVPLLTWVAGNTLGWQPPPVLDTASLVTLLIGMLGLGAYHAIGERKLSK